MKILLSFLSILLCLLTMGQSKSAKSDWAQLNKYAAENKKLKPVSKKEKRIVFMGNSITEFWKTPGHVFFDNHLYVNRGISGQTTSQMVYRFQQDVLALKPAIVVILAGINDIAQNNGTVTLEETFNNIATMAKMARKNRIQVVLSSVLPAFDFPWRRGLQPAPKIVKLNNMIKAYALKNKISYVDYYSVMVDERGGFLKHYSEDGVHPNAAGYTVMEPIVEKVIKGLLKASRKV